jgi:DNA-binding NarL/FixJ family response regulator
VGQLRVVAIDDHQLMLDAIRMTLDEAEGIEMVGEALSATEALPLIDRTQPDLVLLDIRMPQMDGLACLAKIKERFPKVKVVILSGIDEPEQIRTALEQGAAAFVVKHVDPRDLASALRQIADGTVFQVVGASGSGEENAAKTAGITESELKVLRALALHHRADGEVPPDEHLPEARRVEPHGGDALRLPARAGRQPVLRSRLTAR